MDVPGLLIILILGLAIGWAWLVVGTAWLLMRPPRRSYAWAVARSLPGDPSELRLPALAEGQGLSFESWTFRSRGLDLPVWDIRGLKSSGPVMILTHGWGDSRVTMLASGRVAAVLPLVSRLVVWDLPGHGDAPGTCSLGPGEVEDLGALVERVRDASSPKEEGRPSLLLYGFSLGAWVSLRRRQTPWVAAVIAEAPYRTPWTPAYNTLRLRGLPYRSNLRPALALVAVLHRIGRARNPVAATAMGDAGSGRALVVHGGADAITGPEEGQAAALEHAAEFVPVPCGQHTTLFFDPATSRPATAAIERFIASGG